MQFADLHMVQLLQIILNSFLNSLLYSNTGCDAQHSGDFNEQLEIFVKLMCNFGNVFVVCEIIDQIIVSDFLKD